VGSMENPYGKSDPICFPFAMEGHVEGPRRSSFMASHRVSCAAFKAACRDQVLEPASQPIHSSIAVIGATGVKRKRLLEEPSAGTSLSKRIRPSRLVEPFIGPRPIFPVAIRLQCSQKWAQVNALLDSGATTFCLSDCFANQYMILKVQRDHPQEIKDVAG